LRANNAGPVFACYLLLLIINFCLKHLHRFSLILVLRTLFLATRHNAGRCATAVLAVGLLTGQTVVLGLAPTEMALLVMTLILSTLTFSGLRTTVLEGAVHLILFFVYLVLIFSP